MQETWVWSLGQEDPLEKGMTTHLSIVAWIIPRTGEPGRLQSTGSQRVRRDWATNTQALTLLHRTHFQASIVPLITVAQERLSSDLPPPMEGEQNRAEKSPYTITTNLEGNSVALPHPFSQDRILHRLPWINLPIKQERYLGCVLPSLDSQIKSEPVALHFSAKPKPSFFLPTKYSHPVISVAFRVYHSVFYPSKHLLLWAVAVGDGNKLWTLWLFVVTVQSSIRQEFLPSKAVVVGDGNRPWAPSRGSNATNTQDPAREMARGDDVAFTCVYQES